MASLIHCVVGSRLTVDPTARAKPLHTPSRSLAPTRRRGAVIYLIDQARRVVTIIAIRHRKDVYEGR